MADLNRPFTTTVPPGLDGRALVVGVLAFRRMQGWCTLGAVRLELGDMDQNARLILSTLCPVW